MLRACYIDSEIRYDVPASDFTRSFSRTMLLARLYNDLGFGNRSRERRVSFRGAKSGTTFRDRQSFPRFIARATRAFFFSSLSLSPALSRKIPFSTSGNWNKTESSGVIDNAYWSMLARTCPMKLKLPSERCKLSSSTILGRPEADSRRHEKKVSIGWNVAFVSNFSLPESSRILHQSHLHCFRSPKVSTSTSQSIDSHSSLPARLCSRAR